MLNPCEDAAEIQKLVAQALIEIHSTEDGPKPALITLSGCGTRVVFEVARDLCYSANPTERAVGIAIFSAYGKQEKDAEGKTISHQAMFVDEIRAIYLDRLQKEDDLDNTVQLIIELSTVSDESIVEPVIAFSTHPHWRVRRAITWTLHGHTDEKTIATLLQLSQDADEDVREWATFDIGELCVYDDTGSIPTFIDTPAIREALYRNINDSFPYVRYDAFAGLAYRLDKDIIPQIIELVATDQVRVDTGPWEAFCFCLEHYQTEIDDPRLPEILRIYHEKR